MNKENVKKATLKDFLAKKIKKEEDKNKTMDIYVPSMNKTITLVKPSESQIIDYADAIGDNTNYRANLEANRELIYKCCAELQNPELHEALEITDPLDVTRVLFDLEDVKEIMNQFKKLISHEEIENEIKNL